MPGDFGHYGSGLEGYVHYMEEAGKPGKRGGGSGGGPGGGGGGTSVIISLIVLIIVIILFNIGRQ